MSEPSVRRTSRLVLACVAAGAVLFAMLAYTVLDRVWALAPSPGPAGLWIALFAVLTAALASIARRKIQRERARVDPTLATRWLALAKTGAFAGAALAGFFVGWAALSWPHHQTAAGGPRTLWSALAAAAGLAWCIAGIALERACVVPDPPDGTDADEGDDGPAPA